MSRIAGPGTWILGALLGLSLLGCQQDGGDFPPNLPPVTFLDIQGVDVDTTDYRQALHWWGSDRDGSVVGYIVRWDGAWTPPEDATPWAADPSFLFTTATVDTFVVPTGGTYAERNFEVYAVDDDGALDPAGRHQRFRLRNALPELGWSQKVSLPPSSLPAVTFAWSPFDLDGRATVTRYRYWLDGQDSSAAPLLPDTLIALGPPDFAGRYGERTISAQAFDESGAASNVVRHTWTVEVPTGSYLLIDNASSDLPGGSTYEDAFYRAIMDSVVLGDYFVYNVEQRGNFRSDKEVYPLFSLFDGVVWYSGLKHGANDASTEANLKNAEAGMGRYLDDGGRIWIQALTAVGDTAGLSMAFVTSRFGVADIYRKDRKSDFSLPGRTTLETTLEGVPDSIGTRTSLVNADFMLAAPDASGLVRLRRNLPVLAGATPDPEAQAAWVGIMRQGSSGRTLLLTFLLGRISDPNHVVDPNRVGAVLLRRFIRG